MNSDGRPSKLRKDMMTTWFVVVLCASLCLETQAVVSVTSSQISVACGYERTEGFGPIEISVSWTPDDISTQNGTVFPQGHEATVLAGTFCSQTIDTTTNPWNNTLLINTANLTIGTAGPCGQLQTSSDTVEVDFVIREGAILDTEDAMFTVSCKYTPSSIPNLGAVGTADIINSPTVVPGEGTPNVLDRSYELTLVDAASLDVLRGAIPIGTEVKFRVRMFGNDDGGLPLSVAGDENGLMVKSCQATNDKGTNVIPMLSDWCTVEGIVTWPDSFGQLTLGFETTSLQAYGPKFTMFGIGGGDTAKVQFECYVEVCRASCNGKNCPTDTSRRRRSLHKREATYSGETVLKFVADISASGSAGANGQNGGNGSAHGSPQVMFIVLGTVGALCAICVAVGVIVILKFRSVRAQDQKP
ncbi:unnamed protein product [Owenia fusiformis]|uniref:Uncharacterized protein n=1 Tax=Owenia fusiformis TaxID=6347 RepID=A0A8J1TEG9_OWEFU|nr:unnamed protein product [Owenia fusiformis]